MSIFRESALRKMSSPENLDEAVVAASPAHWLAFSACLVLVSAAVAWGFLGSVPTRVQADGILLQRGSEVFSAAAEGSGELIAIHVAPGDRVKAGQTVAELDQDVDVGRRRAAEERLARAQRRLEEELEVQRRDDTLRADLQDNRRRAIESKIANARARHANLRALVDDLRGLRERGLVQRIRVLDRENELIQVQESIDAMRNELLQIDEEERRHAEDWHKRIKAHEKEVESAADQLKDLERQLVRTRTIEAPIDGVVSEVSASLGDVLAVGTPVLRLLSDSSEMEALLFVKPADGKLVKPGFTANVEPSVAKKEEYGTILGEVRSVSHLPISAAAMQAMLHNEKLVEQFTRHGSPVAVRALLGEADDGETHLQWSSDHGPDFTIEPGTLATATITVRRQRPVSLILPFLKSLLGA